MHQMNSHQCGLVLQKCPHVCPANQMLKGQHCLSAFEVPNLIADVSKIVSEQCKRFTTEMGKTAIVLCDGGENFVDAAAKAVYNRIKESGWYKHLVRSTNICERDYDGAKERIRSARKNRRNSKKKIRSLEESGMNLALSFLD